jgi:hypothetical protein
MVGSDKRFYFPVMQLFSLLLVIHTTHLPRYMDYLIFTQDSAVLQFRKLLEGNFKN